MAVLDFLASTKDYTVEFTMKLEEKEKNTIEMLVRICGS